MTGTTTAPELDPALTHDVGRRAWEWLMARREYFRPQPRESEDPTWWLKPVGEFALLASTLLREGAGGQRQTADARAILQFCWYEVLMAGDVLDRAQRESPLATAPLELYAIFHAHGQRHTGYEETLQAARALRESISFKVTPFRRLGVAIAEHEIGLSTGADIDELLDHTLLGQQPAPWTVDNELGYEITHTIFYLTRWGAHPHRIPDGIRDYLQLWLPVWLRECRERQKWDLLAELLATDACLPQPSMDTESWSTLAQAQTPDGGVPVAGRFPTGEPETVFELAYHPTIVTAWAATLTTSRLLSTLTATP